MADLQCMYCGKAGLVRLSLHWVGVDWVKHWCTYFPRYVYTVHLLRACRFKPRCRLLCAGQASALSSKVSLLMIKYDLEHSGSGPGGMSVAEAIECAYHVWLPTALAVVINLNRKALGVLAVARSRC